MESIFGSDYFIIGYYVLTVGASLLLIKDTKKTTCKTFAGLNIAGLAKRSTFVIDKQGIIRKVFRDIDVKSHGKEIVDFLNHI